MRPVLRARLCGMFGIAPSHVPAGGAVGEPWEMSAQPPRPTPRIAALDGSSMPMPMPMPMRIAA